MSSALEVKLVPRDDVSPFRLENMRSMDHFTTQTSESGRFSFLELNRVIMNTSIEKWYLCHLITIQRKDDPNLKALHQCRKICIPFDVKDTLNANIQAALVILPHPINRQCLSIRLLNAIFSPISVQAG